MMCLRGSCNSVGVASILFCHFVSFLELLTSRSLCAECIGSSIIENIVYMTNLSSGLHVTKQEAEPKVHGVPRQMLKLRAGKTQCIKL